uniref:AraC-like ligand-binding domain-containing protein n=1 Tax=Gordonia sp. B7-2 TaxID=3420932 RepID=UPI003D8C5CF6
MAATISRRPERHINETTESAGGRDWWTNTLATVYCEMDPQWSDRGSRFTAELSTYDFGDLQMTNVHADGHSVIRTPAMISGAVEHDLFLCAVTAGPGTVEQKGEAVVLDHGDFTVIDSALPYRFDFPQSFTQTVVRIPRQRLIASADADDLDSLRMRRLGADTGAGAVVSRLVQQLASDRMPVDSGIATALSAAAIDMMLVALTAGRPTESATDAAHRDDLLRAQTLFRARLGDETLTISSAAADLGMSVRYLQKIFATAGTAPREWLTWIRLERARTLLLSGSHTVAELSQSVGFRESSHFSRAFSARFGMSPGRFRRAVRAGENINVAVGGSDIMPRRSSLRRLAVDIR